MPFDVNDNLKSVVKFVAFKLSITIYLVKYLAYVILPERILEGYALKVLK
jgi:hypothetical protein